MKIIKVQELTVANGDVIVLPFCKNEPGNVVTGAVDIQTSTNVPYSVTASVDGENYAEQKLINMGTFAIASTVSSAGHYMFPSTGLCSAKITAGGAGKIYIKEIF